MPKVLHVLTWLNPGGIEKWLLSLLPEFRSARWQLDFACKGPDIGALAPVALQHGSKVFHTPLTLAHYGFLRDLTRLVEEREYDVIHGHLGVYSALPVLVATKTKRPVISSFHNTVFRPQTWTRRPGVRRIREFYAARSVRYAVTHSDVVTGCSRGVLRALPQDVPGSDQWRVVHYGVNVNSRCDDDESRAFRRSLDVRDDAKILLHVGRFHRQKNHPAVLEIHRRVAATRDDAYLVLVGEGPDRESIESCVDQQGLRQRVRFLGARSDVPSIMACSDVLLLPSFHEGLPVVALEANAAGLPVVGSNIPGLDEAVRDGETGFLFETEDVAGMASCVTHLLGDGLFLDQTRRAAQERARSLFSVSASASQLQELYDECNSLR